MPGDYDLVIAVGGGVIAVVCVAFVWWLRSRQR